MSIVSVEILGDIHALIKDLHNLDVQLNMTTQPRYVITKFIVSILAFEIRRRNL